MKAAHATSYGRTPSVTYSRPGSGDSARAAGRNILGIASPQRPSADRYKTKTNAEARDLPSGASLRMMLPSEMQEMVFQLPTEAREHSLAADADVVVQRGLEEAIRSIAHAPRGTRGDADRWHGLLGQGAGWSPPKVVARSQETARPGYDSQDASEYVDTPEVLKAKAKLLAKMWIRSGPDTVLYTGAGLSTASGIGDYASKASNSIAPHKGRTSVGSRLDLQPTLAHHALAAIEEKGLIGNWVQQNHDRLAQKAGCPQAKINEIHGAWGDMKNQVKMMDDLLRPDLMDWLEAWAKRTSMCVALGTSLCGMNADQVPRGVAERFARSSGEGLVIIGLQQTPYDDVASLRIWGLCDDIMKLVAKEIGCKVPDPRAAQRGQQWTSQHPRCSYNTKIRAAKDPM
eukprot:TRINITY_DN39_c1_g3_i1.p1 TRINITY_DN39_c1_g3~~TRINITY_DN39_c1_g3_i1.p1  ORF type:complete len:401 (+),score=61.44 TRINITY_DN39_c1_g3_i1:68-1270(+)